MTAFQAAVALFAAFMLFRHVPAAVRVLRGGGAGPRGSGIVSIVNVLLAVVLLAVTLKALVAGSVSR